MHHHLSQAGVSWADIVQPVASIASVIVALVAILVAVNSAARQRDADRVQRETPYAVAIRDAVEDLPSNWLSIFDEKRRAQMLDPLWRAVLLYLQNVEGARALEGFMLERFFTFETSAKSMLLPGGEKAATYGFAFARRITSIARDWVFAERKRDVIFWMMEVRLPIHENPDRRYRRVRVRIALARAMPWNIAPGQWLRVHILELRRWMNERRPYIKRHLSKVTTRTISWDPPDGTQEVRERRRVLLPDEDHDSITGTY
jgi:hypothetical protein